jgi:tetratricopeptide (TPR) repeat protein
MNRRALAASFLVALPLVSLALAGDGATPLPRGSIAIREIRALPEGDAEPAVAAPPTRQVEHIAMVEHRDSGVATPKAPAPARTAAMQKASPAMMAVFQQAEACNRQGLDLANRGAHFSARAEFIRALRTIAEGLDCEQGTSQHRQALAAAMRAMEEAEDLVPRGSSVEGDLDVLAITRSHRTPALKGVSGAESNPAFALQRYYAYAEEQFSAAIGGAQAGSMSLYALGKLHGLFSMQKPPVVIAADAKSVVYYQAALLVDPANYLAANDLGVQLVKAGRYPQARALLVSAAQTMPQAATWHNLAVVHARMGETRLAELAHQNEVAASGGVDLSNAQAVAAAEGVRWVDPKTFASAAKPATDMPPAAKPENQPPAESPVARKPGWMSWGSPK